MLQQVHFKFLCIYKHQISLWLHHPDSSPHTLPGEIKQKSLNPEKKKLKIKKIITVSKLYR